MASKVIRYQCNFCSKIYASKSYCEKHHEPVCFRNPLRKSCGTCKNFREFDGYDYDCKSGIDLSHKLKVECFSYVQKENN